MNHYTATARSSNGQYYYFNDSTVKPITEYQVFAKTDTYILFYELDERPSVVSSIPSTFKAPCQTARKTVSFSTPSSKVVKY